MLIVDVKLDCTYVTELICYYFHNGTIYSEVLKSTVDPHGEIRNFYDGECGDIVSWDVTPCSLVENYHCVGGTCCPQQYL
jgi:hypothetical protein